MWCSRPTIYLIIDLIPGLPCKGSTRLEYLHPDTVVDQCPQTGECLTNYYFCNLKNGGKPVHWVTAKTVDELRPIIWKTLPPCFHGLSQRGSPPSSLWLSLFCLCSADRHGLIWRCRRVSDSCGFHSAAALYGV